MMDPHYYQEIIQTILDGDVRTKDEIQRMKISLCKKYSADKIPSDADILAHADDSNYEILEPILMIKPVRTISGVAVVAVMTSPHDCPHGKCVFCPGGVEKGTAQSYTGREPAAMRAANNDFDPFKQVTSRLNQLRSIGHRTGKVDLIIMGGTFTAREPEYQEMFIKGCFDGMNGSISRDIHEAHELNQTADSRCIGMTVETRPDHFMEAQIDYALKMGATRVELGVQTLNDATLLNVKRGHGIKEITASASGYNSQTASVKVGSNGAGGYDYEPALNKYIYKILQEDKCVGKEM